jgi:hypothetical protein
MGSEENKDLFRSNRDRQGLIYVNEFKIRSVRFEAIRAGWDDVVVFLLDREDERARTIYAALNHLFGEKSTGQPQPNSTLTIAAVPYQPLRGIQGFFTPNARTAFDAASPTDIRVALISENRMMTAVFPEDGKFEDANAFPVIQPDQPPED